MQPKIIGVLVNEVLAMCNLRLSGADMAARRALAGGGASSVGMSAWSPDDAWDLWGVQVCRGGDFSRT